MLPSVKDESMSPSKGEFCVSIFQRHVSICNPMDIGIWIGKGKPAEDLHLLRRHHASAHLRPPIHSIIPVS